MTDIPHFSLPFRFVTDIRGEARVPVTEQDSIQEIGDCVELIVRTVQGERDTLPGFGRSPMLEFTVERELAESILQRSIDTSESRVSARIEARDLDLEDPGVIRLLTMYRLEGGEMP